MAKIKMHGSRITSKRQLLDAPAKRRAAIKIAAEQLRGPSLELNGTAATHANGLVYAIHHEQRFSENIQRIGTIARTACTRTQSDQRKLGKNTRSAQKTVRLNGKKRTVDNMPTKRRKREPSRRTDGNFFICIHKNLKCLSESTVGAMRINQSNKWRTNAKQWNHSSVAVPIQNGQIEKTKNEPKKKKHRIMCFNSFLWKLTRQSIWVCASTPLFSPAISCFV